MEEISSEQRTIYLRGLLQRYGTLSLPLGSGLSFSLIQVFQPLRLRQSAADKKKNHAEKETRRNELPETREEQDEAEAPEEALDVLVENGLEALNKSPQGRIVILGGPGTGKTTVLKHLLCHQAQLALENRTAPLPIFLSLPDVARSGQDLDIYLAHMARDLGLETDNEQALSQSIQRGHAFVCLDSLDEVLPRLRAGIIRQVNELAQQSGNTWIVGSRFTDYKGGQFQQGQFQEWELQALDEPRRLDLAGQLLPELQRQLVSSAQATLNLHPRDYVQALSEHRQAATWGENPLLFSLGAVVYLRRGSLSGSRALLYREVIDALLETREHDVQQREQLRHILADVALELYQIKGRTFSVGDLRTTLTSINSEQQATWNIEATLYRILNAGLLDVVAYEIYSFRHQTFQEYLVASALAQRFMSENAIIRDATYALAWSKHTYSRWHEIERLLIGILVQEYGKPGALQARAWLEQLLQQQSSAGGDPGNLSLELALKVLGEVAELEAWQAEATLGLEVMAAEVWVTLVTTPSTTAGPGNMYTYNQRLRLLASEIGHLRPSAQEKALAPLFRALQRRGHRVESVLGAIHSQTVTERLRTEWQAHPENQFRLSQIFLPLQASAPVDLLLPQLQTKEESLLQQAVQVLKSMGKYAPVPGLLALLNDARAATRTAAADVLIEVIGQAEIPVEPLLKWCQHNALGTFDAARILARLRHPAALEPLLAVLQDTDKTFHAPALRALADLGTLVPVHWLTVCLNDSDPEIRQWAVCALGNRNQDAPLECFQATLKDPDFLVRRATLDVLDTLSSQGIPISMTHFIEALHDSADVVVVATIQAIGNMGKRAPIELLLTMLHHAESWVVNAILEVLARPQIVERVPLETMLTFYTTHWEYRQQTIATLSHMAQRLPFAFLLKALNDDHPAIHRNTAQILGQLMDSFSVDDLLEDVGSSAWPLRNAAVVILASHEVERTLPSLLETLRDEVPRVSESALLALLKIADLVPLENLLDALNHPSPWVRTNALDVLAKHRLHPQPEPLIVALHDSHASVRAAAARAFAGWTEDAPLEELVKAALDEREEVRLAAAETLGKVGLSNPTLAQEGLLNALNHQDFEDEDAGSSIRHAFAAISPHAPTEPLLHALSDFHRKQKPWLASIVAHALATQGERIPVAALREALQHPETDIRLSAIIALGGAGAAAPIDELIKLLDGPPESRNTLIGTLNSLYAYVPEAIFLRIWREETALIHYAYKNVLQAMKNKGGLISTEILAQAIQKPNFFSSVMAEFLGTLDELYALPTDMLIPVLVRMRTRQNQKNISQSLEKAYATLIPRVPLSTLFEALRSPHVNVRQGVLLLWSYHPEQVPQETLIAVLKDAAPPVRRVAIELLQTHTAPLPVQSLLRCLHDTDLSVRNAAITALGTMGTTAPIEDLLTLLNSTDAMTRTTTLTALRQPGLLERVPIDAFLYATGDAELNVRNEALKALKEKDRQRAITCCLAALGNSMPHAYLTGMYQTAFEILQEIHPAIIPEILQEANSLLQGGKPGRFFRSLSMGFLAETIGNMGRTTPDLIARLSELLDWPYWEVRMKAAQALGKLQRNIPDATIRRLLELRHDPLSRAVREAADEALAEILSLEDGIEDD